MDNRGSLVPYEVERFAVLLGYFIREQEPLVGDYDGPTLSGFFSHLMKTSHRGGKCFLDAGMRF